MSDTPIQEDTQPFTPVREQPQGGGCGCWIPALLTLFAVAILVIAGLFLPPINLYDRLFGVQYAMLSADANASATNDQSLTVKVDPNNPGSDFGVALTSLSMNDFMAGGADVAAAQAAIPPYLALQSQVYTIETTGTEPGFVLLELALPASVSQPDLLDLYGYDGDTGQWHFISAHADATSGKLIASVEDLPDQVALFQPAPPRTAHKSCHQTWRSWRRLLPQADYSRTSKGSLWGASQPELTRTPGIW
jgi:hypothetical protein